MQYKKIILKLSGEALSGPDNFCFNFKKVNQIVEEIKIFSKEKINLAIVIGAGNIFRARMLKNNEIDRVSADYMGMLATNLNALALYNVLQQKNIKSYILSELAVNGLIQKFNVRQANYYWRKNQILIFGGGTGKPYFTTDTCALLKALEMKADIVLKATQVAGVYDKDPKKYLSAKMFKKLTYQEVLDQKLEVMDREAFQIAQKNKIPIRVFKWQKGNLEKVINGQNIGTIISD